MDNHKKILLAICVVLTFFICLRLVAIFNQAPPNNWIWSDVWYDGYTPYSKIEPNQPQEEAQPNKQITATSLDEAKKLAKQYDKSIFVMFSAEWCFWCQKLKKDTFPDPRVEEELKNYVFLTIDTDQDTITPSRYNVRGIPNILVLDADGEVIKQTSGWHTPEDLISWLRQSAFLAYLLS